MSGELSVAQKALMARLRSAATASAAVPDDAEQPRANSQPALPAAGIEQKVMLAYEVAHPGTVLFNMPFALQLDGLLDRDALMQAMRCVLDRHEPLRSRYAPNGISVAPTSEFQPQVLDATGLPPAHQQAALQRMEHSLLRQPFKLAEELPLRMGLLTLSDRTHVLFLCVHHIAFDGWSAELFSRELSLGYQAARAGMHNLLPGLRHTYWDHVREQQRSHQAPALAVPAVAVASRPGMRRAVTVMPNDLTQALRETCRIQGMSLNAMLLAAYGLLLSVETGDAAPVGLLSANRQDARWHEVIGPLYSSFACTLDPAPHVSLGSYVQATADSIFDSIETTQPPGACQPAPAFKYRFSLDRHPLRQLKFVGIALSLHGPAQDGNIANGIETEAGTQMSLFVREDEHRLHVALYVSDDTRTPRNMSEWMQRYFEALDLLVCEPETPFQTAASILGLTPDLRVQPPIHATPLP